MNAPWIRFVQRCQPRPRPSWPWQTPCIVWTGYTNRDGYGQFWADGRHHYAHRWIWDPELGPIPPGLEIDHLCRTRGCVNPRHMELVTPDVNKLHRLLRKRAA